MRARLLTCWRGRWQEHPAVYVHDARRAGDHRPGGGGRAVQR